MKTTITPTEPDTDYQFGDVLIHPWTPRDLRYMVVGPAEEFEFNGQMRRNLWAIVLTDGVDDRGVGEMAQVSDSGWRLER